MAQSTVSAALCCLKMQAELDNMDAGVYDMVVKKDQTYGTAAAIEDNSNKGLAEFTGALKTKPNGTTVRVDVKYRIPQCGEGTDVDVDFDCTDAVGADDRQEFGYDTFTFDAQVSDKFTIDAEDFDTDCESPSQHLALQISNRARQMYQRYNSKMSGLVAASVGTDYTGATDTATTPLSLKLIYTNPENGTYMPQPAAVTDIFNQYERMGFMGVSPIVISGSRAIRTFLQTQQLFAGNDWGFDPNRMDLPSNVYQDYQLATTIDGLVAENPVITLAPGTFDLVEFYKFDTDYHATENGRVIWAPVQSSGRIVRQKVDLGPAIGINRPFIVDQQIKYDEDCNAVEIRWRKDFGFWTMPQGAFCAGDSYNGKLLWNVVNSAYTGDDAMA